MEGIVIIGSGHAAIQCAACLRENEYKGKLTILSRDKDLPYHRPPISKKYAIEGLPDNFSLLKPQSFFEEKDINIKLDTNIEDINIQENFAITDRGEKHYYNNIVIATGSAPRALKIPGGERAFTLYSLEDARSLYQKIKSARSVLVIGAGFIGLEVAAALNANDIETRVVEAMPLVLSRSVASPIAKYVRSYHEKAGLKIACECLVEEIDSSGVMTSDGFFNADLVISAIGSSPRTRLASKAGLTVNNGIEVNSFLETSSNGVYAIGDNASVIGDAGISSRLESIQNANDQARVLAKTLSGIKTSYQALPCFWSDQSDLKLQMAGISNGATDNILVEDQNPARKAVFSFKNDVLCSVETINWPVQYALSRKILGSGRKVTKKQLSDSEFSLKSVT